MTVDTVQVPKPNPRPPGAEDRVARRVAWERQQHNWSREDLARRMSEAGVPINQSAIYKIEQGTPRRTISLDEALALASVFEIDLDELQSIPDKLIGDRLAKFAGQLIDVEPVVRDVRRLILEIIADIADVSEDARPVFEYMGATVGYWPVEELQADLTRLAELILGVRDDLGKLRIHRPQS